MENKNILSAILILIDLLSYSESFKKTLSKELREMLEIENKNS